MSDSANDNIELRGVRPADIPIFFEHQQDVIASEMAAFHARDRESFNAHWTRLLDDPAVAARTVLFERRVAGNVVSFVHDGQREVGYWLGRAFWGKGIATQALAAFLHEESFRPLYGYVAKHNTGSMRVLEKCGFGLIGEDPAFTTLNGVDVPGFILRLDTIRPSSG